jgi:23S rRNA pseudouridine1911/1915/1917 synthase
MVPTKNASTWICQAGEYTANQSQSMSEALQTKSIPAELAGLRLDQALARMFPEYSRSRLKEWLLDGAITLDGGPRRPRDAVAGGEVVCLQPRVEVSVRAGPEPMALDIKYEDEHLLVINKPAGLVVHPGAGNPAGTLMNGLLHHAHALENVPRAGIIHRIDKDTSGLLLVAKTVTAHTALVRLLAEREIARNYLAVCNGVLTGGGTINEPIARHPVDRKRMSIQKSGKRAVTHYTVIERFRASTYISVKLETGRTHQIRVHFAHRRHALVGDPVYGGRLALPAGASDKLVQLLRRFKRQALHAARLSFVHPVSAEQIELEAPPPADFRELIAVLQEDVSTR